MQFLSEALPPWLLPSLLAHACTSKQFIPLKNMKADDI